MPISGRKQSEKYWKKLPEVMEMKNKRKLLTIALLIASVVLICLGIAVNEPSTVLNKAVHVCMECIGIG